MSQGVDKTESLPEFVDIAGFREGVLYRQATFRGDIFAPHVDMASILIPGGEIRIDRLRPVRETTLFLGHFSMPHMGGQAPRIEKRRIDGKPCITLAIPAHLGGLVVTLKDGTKHVVDFRNIDGCCSRY